MNKPARFSRLIRFVYSFHVIFLGLLFFTSGMGKLYVDHRFPGLMGPPWLEERLAEYQLGVFARFIGYAQIIIGYLMITWRLRRLAFLMLAPMLLNILVITISQAWRGTPWVVGFFILQLAFIFWVDRRQYLHLVIPGDHRPDPEPGTWFGLLAVVVGLFAVVASVSLSYVSLVSGWILSVLGIFIGIFAGRR